MSMNCDRCPKVGFVKRCRVERIGSTVMDLCGYCRRDLRRDPDYTVHLLKAGDL